MCVCVCSLIGFTFTQMYNKQSRVQNLQPQTDSALRPHPPDSALAALKAGVFAPSSLRRHQRRQTGGIPSDRGGSISFKEPWVVYP